jgi:hypothetical protein
MNNTKPNNPCNSRKRICPSFLCLAVTTKVGRDHCKVSKEYRYGYDRTASKQTLETIAQLSTICHATNA